MRHFVLHDPSGAILQTCFADGLADEDIEVWAEPGRAVAFMAAPIQDMRLYRVVDGEVVERATMAPTISVGEITADGADECGISGLPDPCTLALRGAVTLAPTAVTGGSVAITSTVPGSITVQITADPVYKAWEATIHAV